MWLLSFGHGIGDWSRNFMEKLCTYSFPSFIENIDWYCSYNNEIIHVFVAPLNYCLPKHLLTIAKSFAIVFKIPATPIHCSLTFQPSFVLQSTIGGSNIFLMDMNYHYWIHSYQFCIQRTKNSIKNISRLSYQQINFFQTKPKSLSLSSFMRIDFCLYFFRTCNSWNCCNQNL